MLSNLRTKEREINIFDGVREIFYQNWAKSINTSLKMSLFYLRKKIYKFIFLTYKYLIKPKKQVKSIYGIYLFPAFKDRTFKYYFKGTYGTFLSELIKSIDTKTLFVDIGSNQGLYSILAGQNKNIDQVISFEPSLQTSKLLKSNLKLNHITNCKVIQKGMVISLARPNYMSAKVILEKILCVILTI